MTPAGFPHSEIPGSQLGCQLPGAYRRLLRPSSALGDKASTMRPKKLTHKTKKKDARVHYADLKQQTHNRHHTPANPETTQAVQASAGRERQQATARSLRHPTAHPQPTPTTPARSTPPPQGQEYWTPRRPTQIAIVSVPPMSNRRRTHADETANNEPRAHHQK